MPPKMDIILELSIICIGFLNLKSVQELLKKTYLHMTLSCCLCQSLLNYEIIIIKFKLLDVLSILFAYLIAQSYHVRSEKNKNKK